MTVTKFAKPVAFFAEIGFATVALAKTALATCDTSTLTLDSGATCSQANGQSTDLGSIFSTISNVLIFLVGAVAVIMLIIGGLLYVTSNGDSKRVEGAKNTILYAIVGIIVAVLAFAAVHFVITRFTAPATS